MQKFRRTKYGLVVTSAALVALGLTTGMSPYKSVDVAIGGKTMQAGTYASETVGDFLQREGLQVTGYDLVEPARATLLQSGMKIVVKRARVLTLKNGAQRPIKVHTLAGNVRELLQSERISLHGEDTINVPLDSSIRDSMDITITRKRVVQDSRMVPIAYNTVRQSSDRYQSGVDVVARIGQNGRAKVVVRKYYVDGRLITTRESRTVVQQPVDELVYVGTAASVPLASRSDASLVANEVLTMVATAYSNPGGHTATGAPAVYGDVAVDPSVIPLGTKLYIPGYGFATANDTGGAIQGYRIDLCFNSVQQAIDFGRQEVKVYILGPS